MATQSLWRHGAFMRVWSGSTISGVGDQITGLALPWLVLRLTHSPGELGIFLCLRTCPSCCSPSLPTPPVATSPARAAAD